MSNTFHKSLAKISISLCLIFTSVIIG